MKRYYLFSCVALCLGTSTFAQTSPPAAPPPAPADASQKQAPAPQKQTAPQQAQPPAQAPKAADAKSPAAPAFSKEWKMDDLLPYIDDLGKGHDFIQGGRLFKMAGCANCHAFSTYWEGTGMAPDLTSVGTKFTRDFILQSILEPSATINGQYYFTDFHLKSGRVVTGKLMDIVDKKYQIAVSAMAPDAVIEVNEDDVASQTPSPVSPMPVGLLNGFTKDQIIELLAFLDSGGNPDAPIYKQ